MMIYSGPFAPGPIRPVAKPGENVLLIDRDGYYLYKVAFLESIPLSSPVMVNGGALAAGATSAVIDPRAQLTVPDGQMGQYRMRVVDDIIVQIGQPQSLARHATQTQIATINAFTALNFPDDEPSEIFMLEDQRFFLTMVNPRGVAIAQSRVAVYGLKYVLVGPNNVMGANLTWYKRWTAIEEAMASSEKFTVVPIGGWGR